MDSKEETIRINEIRALFIKQCRNGIWKEHNNHRYVNDYFRIEYDDNYKKLKGKATLLEVDDDKSITDNLIKDQESILDLDSQELQFINRYIKYVDNNLFKIFPKEKEAKVADAIMELFRKRENIDILSKKAIYIYIREITESTTPVITKVIKTLKDIYIKLYNIYLDKGYVQENI